MIVIKESGTEGRRKVSVTAQMSIFNLCKSSRSSVQAFLFELQVFFKEHTLMSASTGKRGVLDVNLDSPSGGDVRPSPFC